MADNRILTTLTEYEITDLKNFLKSYLTPEKLESILLSIKITERLDQTIEKISNELIRMTERYNPKPKTFSGSDEIWFDIQEQRYEHLSNFMMSLKFIREHSDQEMQI